MGTNWKYFSSNKGRPRDPRRLIVQKLGYGPNWHKQRQSALMRDDYTCQSCGWHGGGIHVHHISKIKEFVNISAGTIDYESANSLSNLVSLCKYGCHRYYDGHENKSGFVQLK